jgi:hypothetical protein
MSLKHRRSVALSIIAGALILSTVLIAAAVGKVDFPAGAIAPPAGTGPQQESGETSDQPVYVERNSLPPGLRDTLKAAGDRMEKPGKERLIMAGTLARGGDSQSSPVGLILEYPGRLRFEEQTGGQTRVITFDGQSAAVGGGALSGADEDLIETLVYDSVEHFFAGQIRGVATRSLGRDFRSEGEVAAGGEGGTAYDVYEVTETVNAGGEPREQAKLYHFNSDTRLLEKVQYGIVRNGAEVGVEVRLNGWQEVQGQKLPTSVIRLENNFPVLTLTLTSTTIAPRAADGTFGNQ